MNCEESLQLFEFLSGVSAKNARHSRVLDLSETSEAGIYDVNDKI